MGGGHEIMLKQIVGFGVSAMLMKDIADRVSQAKKNRGKSLRRKKTAMLGIGVVIGAIAGAVAGVLYAPKTGKETREDLKRHGGEAWGKMKSHASSAGHRIAKKVGETYDHVITVKKGPGKSEEEPLEECEGADVN